LTSEVRPTIWGWTAGCRRLLAALATLLALTLGLTIPPDPPAGSRPTEPDLRMDPNSAPPGALAALPRLGPVLVGRIVAESARRPFASLDDLDARVRGIGPSTVAALRPFLRFPGDGRNPRH
jgi:competence protein ComEA